MHRWTGRTAGDPLRLVFDVKGETRTVDTGAAILALGGGSWPETGSHSAMSDGQIAADGLAA